ncbi:MAG: phosphoheptose isomerase [Balneolaceae bacterium]
MIQFSADTDKSEVFQKTEKEIVSKGFTITNKDDARPWGGFFVMDESQSSLFIRTFFSYLNPDDFIGFSKLSPKILLVEPQKRLSWQYHHRRAEVWKIIGGRAGVVVSDSDEQGELRVLPAGSVIELEQGQRHRLVGLDEWGIVAEIWKHTNPENPSDENDIVRVEDDFGREEK